MSQLAAYGVNLTPPNPISYNLSAGNGNISSVISQANAATNAANQANNQRYGQMLGVLGNAAGGQQAQYGNALNDIVGNYGKAAGSLSGSLANNQTVFNNEQNRVAQQSAEASSAARQNAVSRGLGNTTITNTLQDQVTRSANDAYANVAASKAQADNGVYQNLANLYQNEGSATSNINMGAGNAYMQGGTTIANAIQNRTDQAPSLSEYASLINGAAAAQNSQGHTTIQTTVPDTSALGQRISNGGVAASMGQGGLAATGGYSSSGGGSGGGGIASMIGGGGGGGSGGGSTGQFIPGSGFTGNDTSPTSGGISSLPGSGTPSGFKPTQAGTPGETGGAGSSNVNLAGATGIYDMQNHLVGYKLPNGQMVPVNQNQGMA